MVSHDTIGDLASLLHDGQSYRIRRDPVRRTWLVSLLSERGDVLDYGEAPTLEAAMAQLVVTLELVAADDALIADTEPLLSAERDNR